MTGSIIQDNKECFLTGSVTNLHEHHVFFGRGFRELSEKYGLKIWLRAELHNMSKEGVHFNRELDLHIKQAVQKRAMQYYGWSKEEFISIFGKNYLEGEV